MIDCMVFDAIFNVINYIRAASAATHIFPRFLFYQYSAQYSFQVTGFIPMLPSLKQWTTKIILRPCHLSFMRYKTKREIEHMLVFSIFPSPHKVSKSLHPPVHQISAVIFGKG